MEIVGVALAIPPTIEICLKYGNELRAMCAALRNAEAEIRERVLRLDYGWVRWSQQLSSLQRIEHMMDQYHREVYAQTLETFLAKLKMVTTQLRGLVVERKPDAVVKKSGYLVNTTINYEARSVKYVLKKKSLDKAIEELEIWQRMSDHSWFLLLKMADPAIDAAIGTYGNPNGVSKTIPSVAAVRAGNQKFKDNGTMSTNPGTSGITFKPKDLAHNIITTIPFSNASLAVRKDGSRAYILNIIICPHPSKYQLVKKDTRDLVRKLQHDEPQTFGLLNCKGFVVEQIPPQPRHNTNSDEQEPDVKFTMIFRHPFHVSFVHSFGFVHKNIRPEALLSFSDGPAPTYYLVGFENFRREDGWTRQVGDDSLEHNLYRHPSRQGASPSESYIMQHDIYSLGVCLLEVGLWVSFIAYKPSLDTRQGASNDDESGYHTSTHHPGLVPIPSASLELPDEVFDDEGNNGTMFSYLETKGKDHMVTLARERLPCVMGTKYAEIVETCLTCLDKENSDFGDASEFEDEDGVRVGVRYIEKVLFQLNVLNV
ncbi:hypothetical protein QBC37DRAFT_454276 [Rhypophila decipiens]|uniref:Protein kinase domain-containing protein n=1 Tax=Rhypophila decipiens TaxID=261697 RepID=A0AAN7B2I4_9PEZI|nr:hypothetical protein QBC37DRAFT_454276 [Rhypophila decipiens]